MKRFLAFAPLFLAVSSWAGDNGWQDLGMVVKQGNAQAAQSASATNAAVSLQQYRRMSLDEGDLRSALEQVSTSQAPATAKAQAASAETRTIRLPLPDGSFATVTATLSEVLSPEVAAQHPEIQTWDVKGTDGKVVGGVIDFNSNGFHAMLDLANGDVVFINPQTANGKREYASLSKRINASAFEDKEWSCAVHERGSFRPELSGTSSSPVASSNTTKTELASVGLAGAGETRNVYDIAIAATGEFTELAGGEDKAFAAIQTTITRVDYIYKRDLSIGLKLVSGTNTVFQDPDEDGYTDGDTHAMMDENGPILDDIIGHDKYDIGHVFAADGTSRGQLESVCDDKEKAQGSTTIDNKWDANLIDTFAVDYVAHEVGHQFGAPHTFTSCQGKELDDTAFEPGSGSTIMSYAGICEDSENLQEHSDAMFHSASIQKILNFAHLGQGFYDSDGSVCASKVPLNNVNPIVKAGVDYTIPAGTPFILSGSATDANGNTLTYSWEQMNLGSAYIRTRLPTTSSSRTIPQIDNLILGQKYSFGEQLTNSSRTWNFRLIARDGLGGIGYDDMIVRTKNTGKAFAVTSPAGVKLVPSTVQSVFWDVAGTNQTPINCSAVDIAITTDKGKTFKTLATKKPNTGSASVTLPATLGVSNYLRVKCSNNIFFALSKNNPKQ